MSDPLEDIEAMASRIAEIEGAVITHLVVEPDLWEIVACIRANHRHAIGKPMSIRAARRNRGHVCAAIKGRRNRREGSITMSRQAMEGIWWEGSRS